MTALSEEVLKIKNKSYFFFYFFFLQIYLGVFWTPGPLDNARTLWNGSKLSKNLQKDTIVYSNYQIGIGERTVYICVHIILIMFEGYVLKYALKKINNCNSVQ